MKIVTKTVRLVLPDSIKDEDTEKFFGLVFPDLVEADVPLFEYKWTEAGITHIDYPDPEPEYDSEIGWTNKAYEVINDVKPVIDVYVPNEDQPMCESEMDKFDATGNPGLYYARLMISDRPYNVFVDFQPRSS